ncbi:hypothetical protein [Streptomyces caelestis]|uniref:hypothetical protein n=1 Tax=Streptomyces caelestis TaxID=36816 RepID=UPI00365024BC
MARWKKNAVEQQQYRHMSDDELRDALRNYRAGEARAAANKGRRSWKIMRQAIEEELQRRGLLDC